jgi:hypothetical protein
LTAPLSSPSQELKVQQKREVDKGQEATAPMRAFVPNLPGVDRDNIDIGVLHNHDDFSW